MKKYYIILLLLTICKLMNAQHESNSLPGTYYLQGVMETASIIQLKPDSSFEFFYSYGAVDRFGSGRWTISNHELQLNSRQRPDADFKLVESKTLNDNFITIQITDRNSMLLSYVQCIGKTKSGQQESTTDSEGEARFSKEP